MFCPKCGKENPDGLKFCGGCGADMTTPNTSAPAAMPAGAAGSQMTFGKAISTCFGKYADFTGRAARPEYWWFYLFTLILSWASMFVDHSGIVSGIVNLGLLLPSLAAFVRRMHDTDRSGWWFLIAFTIIGLIPLIIWLASKGDAQANRFGNPV
jgi:uncharacterized membrane protein YhaH (DUF805 family)